MKHIYYITCCLLIIGTIFSCNKNPGSNSDPATYTLSVANPQWGIGTGGSNNWDMNNDADYIVRVKVQTLDANSNASLYHAYHFTKLFTGTSNAFEDFSIDVPSIGDFVIQVEIEFSECTWQSSTCIEYDAGKKEYFKQKTYNNANQDFTFITSDFNIIYEDCGCN